ncbi:hypothetical protein BbuJD1_J17 (plasmid) [Borreliella burgdorferi JD1]|nr:hypothetical protein BbuJD1_J17 [Borreliella burgdorferi JD1]
MKKYLLMICAITKEMIEKVLSKKYTVNYAKEIDLKKISYSCKGQSLLECINHINKYFIKNK